MTWYRFAGHDGSPNRLAGKLSAWMGGSRSLRLGKPTTFDYEGEDGKACFLYLRLMRLYLTRYMQLPPPLTTEISARTIPPSDVPPAGS